MTNNERGERLQLAYEMAWFIRRNKQIAYPIALEVACRWEIVPPQGKEPFRENRNFSASVCNICRTLCMKEYSPEGGAVTGAGPVVHALHAPKGFD